VDPKNISKLDQIMEEWKKSVPQLIWSMYVGFLEAGFTPKQAVYLAKCLYINSTRRGNSQE